MYKEFVLYFFSYLFKSKTRQKLLFLSIIGLALSSFSLLVLQSTMGGFQAKLIERSKTILGSHVLFSKDIDQSQITSLTNTFQNKGIDYLAEYEIELIIKNGGHLLPVIAHGVDFSKARFFNQAEWREDRQAEMIVPYDVAYQIETSPGRYATIITPSIIDSVFNEIPKQTKLIIDKVITTNVPEIDASHIWIDINKIQNLKRKRVINRVRLYDTNDTDLENLMNGKHKDTLKLFTLKSWEQMHESLVWSLKLESLVMLFLFIGMTLLVSLCIVSGLTIFLDKAKIDFSSFWILGSSFSDLNKCYKLFFHFLTLFCVCSGLILGLIFLIVLKESNLELMPEIFVERKIPVNITWSSVLLSFFIPYGISIIFSYLSLYFFKKSSKPLELLRSIG